MIHGEKINLRLVRKQDLSFLYENIASLNKRGHYFPLNLMSEIEFEEQFYKSGFWRDDFGRFLIVDQQDNMLGSIYYFSTVIYSDALEIGYIIFNSKNRGKGYATEALRLMVAYLFSVKHMSRIQLKIVRENEASKRVALKSNFRFDGVREKVLYLKGNHINMDEYVILRHEFESLSD